MNRTQTAAMLMLLGAACACAGCQFTPESKVRSEQEMLEQQVLSSFERLEDEVYLMASVRAVDLETGQPLPPPERTHSKERALEAQRTREYYRDDILMFKDRGWIGENNNGFLALRPPAEDLKQEDPRTHRLVNEIVAEVNNARRVLMERALATTEVLDAETGMEEVQRIFASRNRREAKPGHWIQQPGGKKPDRNRREAKPGHWIQQPGGKKPEWIQVSPESAE